jgi:hypothetical protein
VKTIAVVQALVEVGFHKRFRLPFLPLPKDFLKNPVFTE